jgi:hypothetical protein
MSANKRIEHLEKQMPEGRKLQFAAWGAHPWTKKQKADAVKKHPGKTFFWKSLSTHPSFEEILADAVNTQE